MPSRFDPGASFSRRHLIGGALSGAALAVAPMARAERRSGDVVHVADFGARGDGATNDSHALAAAARHIEQRGGGTILFDPKVYLIGLQTFGSAPGAWADAPEPIMRISNCSSKVALVGNGATLRCAPGLRYGTFDPLTAAPTRNKLPFTGARERASPYRAAVWLEGNTGGIEVSDFEFDGRIKEAVIGGPWGDTGWQINHSGLWLRNNRGPHLIRRIYSHHHGQDGLVLSARNHDDAAPSIRIEDVRSEYNGRQGMSLTGGRAVTLVRCRFNHTGRNGVIASKPGAGLDFEAEWSPIRDVRVIDSEFVDNFGQGIVADHGDSARISFERCLFVGTTNWAVWPKKPFIRFEDCEIVGALTRCFEDPEATERATRFVGCRFSDDPSRSPTGKVRGSRIDLGGSGNGTLFERCSFRYEHGMQLPWTESKVRYRNCTMTQTATKRSYPRGQYSGTTRINAPPGAVHIGPLSNVHGPLYLNGVLKNPEE